MRAVIHQGFGIQITREEIGKQKYKHKKMGLNRIGAHRCKPSAYSLIVIRLHCKYRIFSETFQNLLSIIIFRE